jgi:DNA-binding CsgD family transcriptional regulator
MQSAERVERLLELCTDREREVVTLRAAGHSWRSIGAQLRIDEGTARRAFDRARRRIAASPAPGATRMRPPAYPPPLRFGLGREPPRRSERKALRRAPECSACGWSPMASGWPPPFDALRWELKIAAGILLEDPDASLETIRQPLERFHNELQDSRMRRARAMRADPNRGVGYWEGDLQAPPADAGGSYRAGAGLLRSRGDLSQAWERSASRARLRAIETGEFSPIPDARLDGGAAIQSRGAAPALAILHKTSRQGSRYPGKWAVNLAAGALLATQESR